MSIDICIDKNFTNGLHSENRCVAPKHAASIDECVEVSSYYSEMFWRGSGYGKNLGVDLKIHWARHLIDQNFFPFLLPLFLISKSNMDFSTLRYRLLSPLAYQFDVYSFLSIFQSRPLSNLFAHQIHLPYCI